MLEHQAQMFTCAITVETPKLTKASAVVNFSCIPPFANSYVYVYVYVRFISIWRNIALYRHIV